MALTSVAVPLASPAGACSCAAPQIDQAFDQATDVFAGTVRGFEDRRGPSSADPVIYWIDVEAVFVGAVTARQPIVTEESEASCGRELHDGERWLFFTRRDAYQFDVEPGFVYTGLCSGNVELGDTDPPIDLDAFAPSNEAPPDDRAVRAQLGETWRERALTHPVTIAGLVVIGAMVVAWVVRSKTRPA